MTRFTWLDNGIFVVGPKVSDGNQSQGGAAVQAGPAANGGYGALVILLAFGVSKLGALIEASNKAIGRVGGPLLGLFLLGMLVKRATAWGTVIGWAAGVAAVIPVCFYSKTSFLWYGVVGCVVTVLVGWLASLLLSFLRPAPVSASGR